VSNEQWTVNWEVTVALYKVPYRSLLRRTATNDDKKNIRIQHNRAAAEIGTGYTSNAGQKWYHFGRGARFDKIFYPSKHGSYYM
jgi:hypothetical protein